MIRRLFTETALVQGALTAAASVAGLAVAGIPAAVGLAMGGSLAIADVSALAFIASTISTGRVRSKVAALTLLVAKMPLLAAAVYVLVVPLKVHAIGLLLGVSTMLPAVFYAAVRHKRLAARETT